MSSLNHPKHRKRERRRRIKRARRRLWAALARPVVFVAERVPERWRLDFGAFLGGVLYRLVPSRRRIARDNLRIAFPDWSSERVDAVARASFAELGRNLVEWTTLPSLTPEELLERVECHGFEHIEQALKRGRGAFLVTAHYGSWELLPAVMAARLPQFEFVAVGRRFENPAVQRQVERRRHAGGGGLVDRDARAILRALRRGAAVGVLVDQTNRKKRGGRLVPFFDKRVWTTIGPATLALRSGAAIVPASIRRVDGRHHRVEAGPEIEFPDSGDRHRDIIEITARMNNAFEALIREHPEPWLWLHQRWRRSPDV